MVPCSVCVCQKKGAGFVQIYVTVPAAASIVCVHVHKRESSVAEELFNPSSDSSCHHFVARTVVHSFKKKKKQQLCVSGCI